MTKETKQLKREIKMMIWQLRWMMLKHWIWCRLMDIVLVMSFAALIIIGVLGISIVMISCCFVYILDIVVSLLTRERHRDACCWLGNKFRRMELWGRGKLKDKESE